MLLHHGLTSTYKAIEACVIMLNTSFTCYIKQFKKTFISAIVGFILLVCNAVAFAQPMEYNKKFIDSIVPILPTIKEDSNKVFLFAKLASMHLLVEPSKTIDYAKEGVELAKKINFPQGVISCYGQSAFCYAMLGEWAKATFVVNEAIPLCEKYKLTYIPYMCNIMAVVQFNKQDITAAKNWSLRAKSVLDKGSFSDFDKWPTYMQLGYTYQFLNQLDSAIYYANVVSGYISKYAKVQTALIRDSYSMLGSIALKKKDFEKAKNYFYLANNDALGLANLFLQTKNEDSAIYYAKKGLEEGRIRKSPTTVQDAAKILAQLYRVKNPSIANQYLDIYIASKDSLFSSNNLKQLEEVQLNAQKNVYELQINETALKNKYAFVFLSVIVISVSVLMILVYKNNRQKHKANLVLQVEKQKADTALTELKAAQKQLVQSEKMASLGELTAGIAHEIQNPLNFVNNFSEVSAELVDELCNEIQQGKFKDAELLAQDLKDNLLKITHHGKRAGDIVKGMLQHSRTSKGVKEPTDINQLADEYLRLAYHGLRAKDKTFNAKLVTNFDSAVGLINVIPQDMGRVILNLITNALYVVDEKKKLLKEVYEPVVTVGTKLLSSTTGGKGVVEIIVTDNGNGIPQNILDKIFQPFFSTKPTGQGTGLGLSLSYDIVKSHGGEITLKTKEGEGSIFIISLPV